MNFNRHLICLLCLTLITACASQMVPIQNQVRTLALKAPASAAFAAVKPALMKNGYRVIEMDAYTGHINAKKINKSRYLSIAVTPGSAKGSHVKIHLTVTRNGRRINVSERTMADLDRILQEIKSLTTPQG